MENNIKDCLKLLNSQNKYCGRITMVMENEDIGI